MLRAISLWAVPAFLFLGVMSDLHARQSEDIVPFPHVETTLENGLRVIVVRTGFPNLVSLQIPVLTGSRNEVEPGKSGFAHFFEHMMFRGTEKYPPEKYQEIVTRAGAQQNAYTTDDYTNYHMTFAKEDLERMLEIEADRFQNLSYSLEAFQTEARAVLGEYNKNFANPIRKLFEVHRNAAFRVHPYKHTTMGFLEDIEDMPNEFEYSRTFFERWYRPENAVVLIVGDVDPDETVRLVEKTFGSWRPGMAQVEIPAEPEPEGPVVVHHEWPTPTAPLLAVAFLGPAFSDEKPDFAAIDMLMQLRFGETSDLHRRLVQEEQVVDLLVPLVQPHVDPYLVTVLARVKRNEDVPAVREAILQELARCRAEPVDAKRLEEAKMHERYALSASLDSSEAVASLLAEFVRFERSFDTINRYYRVVASLTPDQLLEAARRYITDRRLSIAVLSHGDLPEEALSAPPPLESLAAPPGREDPEAHFVIVRSNSPQIAMRFLFLTGSADDPPGKEGLAALTARMLQNAGSDVLELAEIQKLLYPIAGSLDRQVDREMTVFTTSIHRDNLERFADIALDMLLKPGFREEDFRRNKAEQKNELLLDLVRNNDEELGKERLQADIFAGTPYGHPTVGTAEGIDSITLDDVKKFWREHYTWSRLWIGLSGDVPDEFVERLHDRFSTELPHGRPYEKRPRPIGRRSNGITVDIVAKPTRATAISFGHPIDVVRGHPDFVALWVARTWLGEHRSSMSHLYQRIREVRGMNYGDYAYIEAFPEGMFQFYPDPNRARLSQIFEVWIRPVPPQHAVFALKVALHELDKLIREGLSQEDFEKTREYVRKNVYVLTAGQQRELGYLLDSRFFGTPEFVRYMHDELDRLTLEDVNRAIRRHLSSESLHVVMIAPNAEELRDILLEDDFTPMTYDTEKPKELLEEDKVIGARRLWLSPDDVRITPVEEVFRR